MELHATDCTRPEGCSCGATEFNARRDELAHYRAQFRLLREKVESFREPERSIVKEIITNKPSNKTN